MLHYHDHGCLVALFVQNEHDSEKNAYMMYAFLVSRVISSLAGALAIAPSLTATASAALSSLLL